MALVGERAPNTTGIHVTTGFIRLAFAYAMTTPRLMVDGRPPLALAWGANFVPVPPGDHELRCYFRYSFFAHAGDATMTLTVPPGQVIAVSYRAPSAFAFLAGTWSIDPTSP